LKGVDGKERGDEDDGEDLLLEVEAGIWVINEGFLFCA